jgi:hypothetical protein
MREVSNDLGFLGTQQRMRVPQIISRDVRGPRCYLYSH